VIQEGDLSSNILWCDVQDVQRSLLEGGLGTRGGLLRQPIALCSAERRNLLNEAATEVGHLVLVCFGHRVDEGCDRLHLGCEVAGKYGTGRSIQSEIGDTR
jgi:hypothetical protein